MPSSRLIVGLSVSAGREGVDAALLNVEGIGLSARPSVVRAARFPFPADVRDSLVSPGQVNARSVGEALAAAARRIAGNDGELFCIGLLAPGGAAFTTAAESIADQTGATVLTSFSARDLAAGGTGGPLTPAADWLLFRDAIEDRILIHLGSVSSIICLLGGGRMTDLIAFDAGPGHRFLDVLLQRCSRDKEHHDIGGTRAVQGRCYPDVLDGWSKHLFFQRKPPKSVGKTDFDDCFVEQCIDDARRNNLELNDLLCTAAHLIARAVGGGVRHWLPSGKPRSIFLSGGGTRHGMLRQLLAQQFPGESLHALDDLGVPVLVRKAAAAAVLAGLTLDGVTGNLPQLTGATGGRLIGRIVPGDPRNWAAVAAWAAEQMGDYVQAAKAA